MKKTLGATGVLMMALVLACLSAWADPPRVRPNKPLACAAAGNGDVANTIHVTNSPSYNYGSIPAGKRIAWTSNLGPNGSTGTHVLQAALPAGGTVDILIGPGPVSQCTARLLP